MSLSEIREASRINRDERRLSELTPEPSSQLKLVEPHRRRQEHLKKPLALRLVEPRPSSHHCLAQISAPHVA